MYVQIDFQPEGVLASETYPPTLLETHSSGAALTCVLNIPDTRRHTADTGYRGLLFRQARQTAI